MDSPCNKICVINPRTRLCDGCARSLDEIAAWTSYTDAERRRITPTALPDGVAPRQATAAAATRPRRARDHALGVIPAPMTWDPAR